MMGHRPPTQAQAAAAVVSLTNLQAAVAAHVPEVLQQEKAPLEEIAGRAWATLDYNLSQAGGHTACRPGCSDCCSEVVAVVFPEAVLIARTLERSLRPGRLAILRRAVEARAAASATAAIGGPPLGPTGWCAFLDPDEQRCVIYPARPLGCRVYHSQRVAACRERRQGGNGVIPTLLIRSALGSAVVGGLLEGCRASGLDCRCYELHQVVAYCLERRDAESRWLDGEAIPLPALVIPGSGRS